MGEKGKEEVVEVEAKNPCAEAPEVSAASDNDSREVSFHHVVEVVEVSPKSGDEPRSKEEVPLKASPSLEEVREEPVIDEPTMEQLHDEGADKTFHRRFGVEPQVVRRMNKVDLETGKKTWRELTALPIWDFKEAMNPKDRKKGILEGLAKNRTEFDQEVEDDEEGEPQFRLQTDTKTHKEHRWITNYLHWTFRASFAAVILTDYVVFMLFSLFFACCIHLGGLVTPRCFVVNGQPLNNITDWKENFYFMDSFQLSWTTFSTVGYGLVYPNINRATFEQHADCFAFNFMVSLESFLGVLFAAFCGSIIFGKIVKIQSVATIEWSDPMVIRFGTGVVEPKPEVKKVNEREDGSGSDSDSDSDSDDDEDVQTKTPYNKDEKIEDTNGKDKDSTEPTLEALSGPMDKSSGSRKSSGSKIHKYPPPVLEFRVINTLSHNRGAEIMNSNLHVFASTEASKSMESLQLMDDQTSSMLTAAKLLKLSMDLTKKTGRALGKTKNGISKASHLGASITRTTAKSTGSLVQKVNRTITRPSTMSTFTAGSIDETQSDEQKPFNKEQEIQREIAMATMALRASTQQISMDEGSRLVPRRIFSKMEIETDTHPFFKRVWTVRHVLNEDSPLLSAKAKRIIQKHKGKWPQDICNATFIRKNIHFHQIIVQLSGTHNCSGSDVFGMHVYEFQSINIGYRFAQMLDLDEDGNFYLDRELLNDVREQRGGGGEKIRGHMVDAFRGTLRGEEAENDVLHDSGATEAAAKEHQSSAPLMVA